MTYEEASKIGNQIDGYIKCTYANLYRYKFANFATNFPFSFQARHTKTNQVYKDYEAYLDQVSGDTEDLKVTYQVPIVTTAAGLIDADKFVSVWLTDFVLDMVAKARVPRARAILESVTVALQVDKYHDDVIAKQFKGWKCYNKQGTYLPDMLLYHSGYKLIKTFNYPGGSADEFDWWSDEKYLRKVDWGHYKIKRHYSSQANTDGIVPPPGKTLSDVLLTDAQKKDMEERRAAVRKEYSRMFYMKECAIDWVPTDLENVDVNVRNSEGVQVDLNYSLQEAQDKVNKARALLIMAGASNMF